MPNTNNNEELKARLSELESEIIHLKKELKTKVKYGLTFERKLEKVVEECETKLPVLKEVAGKKIETDKTKLTNIIIEGDNYHSLQVLNYTHQGKIDVIYIDPPYNTGNKDFIYNDSFVDKEDSFRHSKWLSFMEKRLLLARDLLSESGVIFISIDDNEQAQLKLLCDSVFGENNLEILIWNKEAEGSSGTLKQNSTVRRIHEYVLCVYRNYSNVQFNKIKESLLGKEDQFQTANLATNLEKERRDHKNYFTIINPKGIEFTRQWKWSKEEIDSLVKKDLIYWGKNQDKQPRLIIPTDERRTTFLLSILNYGGTTIGRKDFEDIFGENISFSYPKPVILLKKLLDTASQKDSTILDFMAGSGTTGHAVLELNKKDGGNRQFILCTNNGDEKSEHKIASDICYPRIQKVIEGYTNKKGEKVAGLGGNLRYFRTTFIDKKKNKDEMKFKITRASTEILCLKEGVFEIVEEVGDEYNPTYTIVSGAYTDGVKVMGIYFDIDDRKLEEMRKKLLKYNAEKVAYIFSLSDEHLDIEHNDWLNIKIESIPEKILNAYQYAYKLTKK